MEDHRKYGGDITVDIAYQYLTFFLEDDEKLAQIKEVNVPRPGCFRSYVSVTGNRD